MGARSAIFARSAGALAPLLLLALAARGATIRVPTDAPTIQAGIDRAVAGDTVLVEPGSYAELVSVTGRSDLLIQGSGINATLWEAPGSGPAFTLRGSSNIKIEGFRLSSVDLFGDSLNGAITVEGCSQTTVHHCMITHQAGNGIIALDASDLHVFECLMVKLGDDGVSFRGGSSFGVVHDCTFADNGTNAGISGGSGIGVWMGSSGSVVVFNCIAAGNDYGLAVQGATGFDHDWNLVYGNLISDWFTTARAPNELGCAPDFVDPPSLDYHILSTSCAVDGGTTLYAGTPNAALDMDLANKPMGAAPDVGADEVGCAVDVAGWVDRIRICEGDTATLDSTVINLPDCPTAPARTWADDALAPAVRDVSPATDTMYEVTVSCPSVPGCEVTRQVSVAVDHRPDPFSVTAKDVAPCNLGLIVQWSGTTFHGPGGLGTYSVYRSEVSCADALLQAPLATGLTATSWVDLTALPLTPYFYAIQAEDDSSPSTCLPGGPNNGGATTLACVSGPASDVVDTTPPTDPGAACMRARHVAEEATMMWPTARALLSDEHFHLIKTWGRPTGGWARVNPENDTTLEFTETDTSARLQCFLLRVANLCETESR